MKHCVFVSECERGEFFRRYKKTITIHRKKEIVNKSRHNFNMRANVAAVAAVLCTALLLKKIRKKMCAIILCLFMSVVLGK